jgi:plastocyanin
VQWVEFFEQNYRCSTKIAQAKIERIESGCVTFTAPGDHGPYEYLCTFTEHYIGGMKGGMTVQP